MTNVKKAARITVSCTFASLLLDTAFLAFYSARIAPVLQASFNVAAPIAVFQLFAAVPLMYLLIAMLVTEVLCILVRGQTALSRQNASNKPWYFCLAACAVLILLYTAAVIFQLTGYSGPFLQRAMIFLISTPALFAFPGILLALSLFMLSEKAE
jgi:hypothetical protein